MLVFGASLPKFVALSCLATIVGVQLAIFVRLVRWQVPVILQSLEDDHTAGAPAAPTLPPLQQAALHTPGSTAAAAASPSPRPSQGAARGGNWLSRAGFDPHGYITYAVGGGQFGNHMEALLGAMDSIAVTNRTFILPHMRLEFKSTAWSFAPFEDLFDVDIFRAHYEGKAIAMTALRRKVAGTSVKSQALARKLRWTGLCSPRRRAKGAKSKNCQMVSGNPSYKSEQDQYWEAVGVDWVGGRHHVVVLEQSSSQFMRIGKKCDRLAFDLNGKFPAAEHPIIATARNIVRTFPARVYQRRHAKALHWSRKQLKSSRKSLAQLAASAGLSSKRRVLGLHVRAKSDYKTVCTRTMCFGCKQCPSRFWNKRQGGNFGKVCRPAMAQIAREVEAVVVRHNINMVFVATDKRPKVLCLAIQKHLSRKLKRKVPVLSLEGADRTPHADLAVLTEVDVFIGNCVSTFTSFVKRYRDHWNKGPSYFWGTGTEPVPKFFYNEQTTDWTNKSAHSLYRKC